MSVFFDNVINDTLTFGIIGWFILWIAAKFRKKTIGETLNDIKDFFSPKEEAG